MNPIEKIVTQMGIISDEVYKDEYFNKNMTLIANSNEYSVVDYIDTRQDDSDSFSSTQALLLKNNITKDYIIAFRGTQEIPDYAIDFTLIPFLNLNPQYKIALNFTQLALEKISDDKQCSIEEAKQYLTLTGHSLGGIL